MSASNDDDGHNDSRHKPVFRQRANPNQPKPYEVGYSKPPREHQWRKGQSGNPRGPAKKALRPSEITRKYAERRIRIMTSEGPQEISGAEAVIAKRYELAMKGNLRAQNAIIGELARLYPETGPDTLGEASNPKALTEEEQLEIILGLMAHSTKKGDRR